MQVAWTATDDDQALVSRGKMDAVAADFPNSSGPCRFVHTQCDTELFTREYLRCVHSIDRPAETAVGPRTPTDRLAGQWTRAVTAARETTACS
jgi:hypothetical protein